MAAKSMNHIELQDLDRDTDYADLPEPPPQYAPTGLTDPFLGGYGFSIFNLQQRKLKAELQNFIF